ncbi:MAG TPA: signal peptidase II [Aeromicrobium sp.]|nr:signal peptidase II [Aeromicrobium sp.]HKY57692.1 signal peptidase II [Aeromicrobium sp.]
MPGLQAARGTTLSHLRLFTSVAAGVWALDQATKAIAVDVLEPGTSIDVLPPVFSLTLTRNSGAAFSAGAEMTVMLSVIAIIVVVTVIRMARRLRDRGWALGLALLLGGALGNLTDRILRAPSPFRGEVVDFLHLTHWPVFNVADIGLTAAAVVILQRGFTGATMDGGRDGDDEDGADLGDEVRT